MDFFPKIKWVECDTIGEMVYPKLNLPLDFGQARCVFVTKICCRCIANKTYKVLCQYDHHVSAPTGNYNQTRNRSRLLGSPMTLSLSHASKRSTRLGIRVLGATRKSLQVTVTDTSKTAIISLSPVKALNMKSDQHPTPVKIPRLSNCKRR